MKKLSSYQKLKAENAKLKSDLRELAARPINTNNSSGWLITIADIEYKRSSSQDRLK